MSGINCVLELLITSGIRKAMILCDFLGVFQMWVKPPIGAVLHVYRADDPAVRVTVSLG